MKISNLLLIILFCFSLKTVGQDRNVSNDSIFILIDRQFKELYSFSKKNNRSATIKILDWDKRGLGFETQTKELEDHEIEVVTAQPPPSNYINFHSYSRPKETQYIKGLKIFSIEDVSRHDKNVWRNIYDYFYFIEKLDSCNYLIWEMSVIFQE